MTYSAKFVRHERMMTSMADRNGADLDVALLSGVITPEEVQDAALKCTGCREPGACEAYLESDATGIPDYCRNADMIRTVAQILD